MVEIENMRKSAFIIKFISGASHEIKMESLKNHIQQFRQFYKFNSSLSSAFFITIRAFIKIILIQNFRFDISLQAEFNTVIVYLFIDIFNNENDILE